MKVKYEVKIIRSTDDKLYTSAINVYATTTPVSIRTSTNEIAQYIDNPDKDSERKMFFFALLCNEKVIGFAELGYLYRTKSLFIDYLSLITSEKTNSNFYVFLNLLIDSIYIEQFEINYVITEVSNRNNGHDIDYESIFFNKLVGLEDFYLINEPYIHPRLGDNTESEFECNLFIKVVGGATVLNRNTYLSIVYDIYYSHYLTWYSNVESKELTQKYHDYITSCYNQISNKTSTEDTIVIANSQVISCDYYGKESCFYNRSTAGSGNAAREKQKYRWWIPLFISAICIIISVGVYNVLSLLNIEYEIFNPILAAIAVLSASAMSYFSKK